MQTVSTAFVTASAAKYRKPRLRFWMCWDPTVPADYTDEGGNLLTFDVSVKLSVPGDGLTPVGTIDSGRVMLRDVGWRYSPWHTGGDADLRPYISGPYGLTGLACYAEIGFVLPDTTTEYCRLFTGYVYGWQHDPTQKTVVLTIRDQAWKLFQRRGSTATVLVNQTANQIIAAVATLAGWSSGDLVLDDDPVIIPFSWLDDEPYYDEMATVASSVGGNLYTNAMGDLVFESASHWLTHPTKAWTFDASYVPPVPPAITPVDLVTEVVVEYSPRVAGVSGVLWSLDKPRLIRPGATETIEARFSQPALAVFALADEDWRAETAGGLSMRDYCTITVTTTASGATIAVQNTNQVFAAVMRFLQLRGVPLVGGPTQQVKQSTGAGDNYRIRSERSNPYLQTGQQAAFLARFLAGRYDSILPVWSIQNAPGVPQLELGDRVGVSDGRMLSSEREGFVVGIASSWRTPPAGSPSKAPIFAQNVDVLDLVPLFGSGPYFAVGTTALSGTGVPGGKAWY